MKRIAVFGYPTMTAESMSKAQVNRTLRGVSLRTLVARPAAPRLRGTIIVFGIVTALISAATAGCSSLGTTGGSTTATSSAGSNTPGQANADSFSGPIVMHCIAQSKSTTIDKMNVDTGELAHIATFPIVCSPGGGQISQLMFSRDFRKAALPGNALAGHAKYFDSGTKSVVDVTNIVAPQPQGDFGEQQRPDHRNAQFDDQGMFVFYDARAREFNFFDTTSQKVTRTSKSYIPRFVQSIVDNPGNVPDEGQLPSGEHYRLCVPWFWVIDDTRYLREVDEGNNHYLMIDAKPAASDERPHCDSSSGQRITPPSTEISDAAADPTGSTVLFTVFSKNNMKMWDLYRANLSDPSHPTPIKMSGNILEHAGYDGGQVVSILDWK